MALSGGVSHIWRRVAWVAGRLLSLFLVISALVSGKASAEEKVLSIVLGAEIGFERLVPDPCPNREVLFRLEGQRREAFAKWLQTEKGNISRLLFGEENRIKAELVTFTLADIRNELGKVKDESGDRTLLFGAEPRRAVVHYVSFLDELDRYDKSRLGRKQSRVDQVPVERYCTAIADSQFPVKAWREEIVRKGRMPEYFDLVAWYLRERVKRASPDSELFVPVLLHPAKVWWFDNAEDAQQATKSIAEVLKGGGDLQDLAKKLTKISTTLSGLTVLEASVDKEIPRPSTNDSRFLRRRRLGVYVGGYVTGAESAGTRRTFIHELGHYVGLPHVFTDSMRTVSDRCRRETGGQSFLEAFDKADISDSKRKSLCECFFTTRNNRDVFEDADGADAGVFDTPLALYKGTQTDQGKGFQPIRYLDRCALETISGRYKMYFDGKLDASRSNVMTYIHEGESGAIEDRQKVTEDQGRVASEMLKTFK